MTKRASKQGHHGHEHHDRYGNPDDLQAYVARQLDPARTEWQQPDRVIKALGIRKGAVVAEIGAGPGFWTMRLARTVGPSGHVYSVDPVPAILNILRNRLEETGIRNVTPVLGSGDDPFLPQGVCDVALVVNTYHHFPDGPSFLRGVARTLRRGGRLVNIDFAKRETPVGPPVDHRVDRDDFLRDARRAGLALVTEHGFLPHQYFLVLRPRNARAANRR